jgi:hypothetical protein
MNSDLTDQSELDIFTLDVSDDALERAGAIAGGQYITIGACTHWYACNWPQSPAQRAGPPQT